MFSTRIGIPGPSRRGGPLSAVAMQAIFGSSLELWLRSDRGIVLASGAVSQWRDQSGKGRHFSQGTAANRPTYNAVDANWGLPSLGMNDGTRRWLDSDDAAAVWKFLHDGTDVYVLAVMYYGAQTDSFPRIMGTADDGSHIGYILFGNSSSVTLNAQMAGGSAPAVYTAADSFAEEQKTYIETAHSSSGSLLDLRAGGTTINTDTTASGSLSASDPTATLRIGANLAGTNQGIVGQLLEIVAASVYPSATQLAQVDAYMTARYPL